MVLRFQFSMTCDSIEMKITGNETNISRTIIIESPIIVTLIIESLIIDDLLPVVIIVALFQNYR